MMATYSQIEQLLAQQAQTLKTELKKEVIETMVENVVTKVVAQLKTNIAEEVTKAIEPIKTSQERSETEVARLRADLETLAGRVDGQETERRDWPHNPPAVVATVSGEQRPGEEEEKIKEMFREANSTLTFSPIAEEDWRQLTTHLVEEENMGQREAEKEAGYRMVEEFLAQEMLMKDEHIHDVMTQVESLRPKVKAGWNAVVVRFKDQDIADWILRGKGKMRRGVEGTNKPVVENWVPGGLYKRYNALRSVAYRLRQRDGLKTRINFGNKDFTLVTKKDSKDHWSAPVSLAAESLPGFQLSDVTAALAWEQRSPTMAPGRARYGGTAARQGKRPLAASPGLSPRGKEQRLGEESDGGHGAREADEVYNAGEDRNVTARKDKKKSQE
jgi:hypothetical protein